MGTKTKKFLVVLLALVMCFALSISLVACKDKDPDDDEKAFDTTLAQQYSTEIAASLAKTIKSVNLADGFKLNLGLNIKVDKTSEKEDDTNLTVSIVGNVLNNATDANNDFRIQVKNGENLVFGMYNEGTSLGIKAGGEVFHFKDASIMKVLKLALTRYAGDVIPDSLGDIAIEGQGLDTLLSAMLPAALQTLCAYGPVVKNTQQIDITYDNGKYVFGIQTDALKGLLSEAIGGLDTSFIPAGAVIKCTLEKADNGTVKNLAVNIKPSDNSFTTDVTVNSPSGWFTAVDAEFDAEMPAEISEKVATNLLTAEVNSTIKFVANDGSILRDMTMDFKIDMNPLVLLENELTSENIKKLGYFILNVKVGNQPLIGLAFDPEHTGTDSVYLYLQLANHNTDFTVTQNNYVLASEMNISTLLDIFLFKTPTATFKPIVEEPTPALSLSSQTAELPLDMIFGLLSSIIPDLNITDEQIGYINDMIGSVVPVRDEAAGASGMDIDAATFMSSLGKLVGDEKLFTEPIAFNITIPGLLFGAPLDGDKGIGSIQLRTADGAATFNKPITAPTSFNPNDWITSGLQDAVNDGNGYIKPNTITTDALTVEYGTPLKDYLGDTITVDYEGFDSVKYTDENLFMSDLIGYDPYKVGKQEVLVQVGTKSSILNLLSFVQGVLGVDNIHAYLVFIPLKLEVTVLDKVDANAVSIEYGEDADASREAVYEVKSSGSKNKVFAGIDPVIKIAERSYHLKDHKYMITELPAEYDATGDTLSAIGEYTFGIETAGVKTDFTVKSYKFKINNTLTDGIDFFNEDKLNTISYFDGATIVELDFTADNFVSANIGETTFELNADNQLIIPDTYRGEKVTINFKATVYGKEVTCKGEYTIIPNTSLAEIAIAKTEGTTYDLLDGLVKLTIYADNKLQKKDLPLRNYARLMTTASKELNNFTYGFMQYSRLIEGVTVNIEIWNEDRTSNVSNEVFKKGMITKAGIYDIKITGTVKQGDETLDLMMNGSNDIWVNDYIVKDVTAQIRPSDLSGVMKGQSLDNKSFGFGDFPIAEYPVHGSVGRILLDKLIWNEDLGQYVVTGDTKQLSDAYMGAELKAKITAAVTDGVPVTIEHQDADGAWNSFVDGDGFVTYSGTLTAGKLRYTINWGGGETGLEKIIFYAYNTDNYQDNNDITIKAATYEVVDNKTTVYVNEKLPVINKTTYVAGEKVASPVETSSISSESEVFNADGYLKFTAAGTYEISITDGDATTKIAFTVKEATLSIPADQAEFNFLIEVGFDDNWMPVVTPITTGTSIWDILATKSTGKFENVTVDANGLATGGALTAEEFVSLGFTVKSANIVKWEGFTPSLTPLLDDSKTNTVVELNESTLGESGYIQLVLVLNEVEYTYTIKIAFNQ